MTEELPTRIEGVRLFARPAHSDERGSFRRVFSESEYRNVGLVDTFVEDNVSTSWKGVLRGLHYDFRLAKFVQVLQGVIFDVVADIRKDSPTFGQWESFRLSAAGCEQLYVPRGFAHGFYVLSDQAVVAYKQTAPYEPTSEGQVAWNDPSLAIAWPLDGLPILSQKDAGAPRLDSVPSPPTV
jgi:dTDP-4-dehydrorhamnose 3,5-epimerase